MTTNTATEYRISVRIVDQVDNQGDVCEHCQEDPIMVTLYLPIGSDVDRHVETRNAECCTSCLVAVVDSTDYLEASHTIVAEVAHAATSRPF